VQLLADANAQRLADEVQLLGSETMRKRHEHYVI
jgi:hypothetical protein